MKKIGFKVSARAARLIGRENVTNAEGAIIELVKNAYDADATLCILFFDKSSHLNILDNGDGMDSSIIENHWMTIGTNRKEKDIETDSGRIRTGAKGIGRFALDRLGKSCELITKPKGSKKGHIWNVNWEDFEGASFKTIGEVQATLDDKLNLNLQEQAEAIIPKAQLTKLQKNHKSFSSGTLIKIKSLRDVWDQYSLDKLYKNLGILIPPKEEKDFSIILLNEKMPKAYGEISAGVCDDYDYKIEASADADQIVTIKISLKRSSPIS